MATNCDIIADDASIISSTASCMTDMTISAFGEDMKLEDAVDQIFKGLQQSLNYSHSEVRCMAVDLDRDGDYRISYEHHEQICDYVDELGGLLMELKRVSLQVLGKPPDDDKEWFKEQVQNRKNRIKAVRDNEKVKKQIAKQLIAK
jgi:hypothetical protein